MKDYQIIITNPEGIEEEYRQKARTQNLAVLMVKGAHYPGQPVKARVIAA